MLNTVYLLVAVIGYANGAVTIPNNQAQMSKCECTQIANSLNSVRPDNHVYVTCVPKLSNINGAEGTSISVECKAQ